MYDLAWYLFSIATSLALSYLARQIVVRLFDSPDVLTLYDEFAGNFVTAVALMETIVLTFVGHSTVLYLTCMYVVLFARNLFFTVRSLYETPCVFIDLYYLRNRQHNFSIYEMLVVIAVQSVAVQLGISYTKLVWMFIDEAHGSVAKEACLSTLSHEHNWFECFSVEMVGTFVYVVIDFMMSEKTRLFTRPLVLCAVVWSCGHVTGAWLNPMLATLFTFRCHGHDSDIMHVLVYWIAPFLGFFLAWEGRMFFEGSVVLSGEEIEKEKEE